MDNNLQSCLTDIARSLNESGIVWGVGASILLHQYGLVEAPNDIDIIVQTSDIDKADNILCKVAKKINQKEKSGIYSTDFFFEYLLRDINIDVMAGFKINTEESVYEYKFDKKSAPHTFKINGTNVPFMTLEDWYVLYQLIPNREHKVSLIESYFKKNGIKYLYLIERSLNNETLPNYNANRINTLLKD